MNEPNPYIIHRIYFDNFAPFHDPFEHYLETWYREMPQYKVMKWNLSNLDVEENAWTRKAFQSKAPVFLAEYFRWKLLSEYGGIYLDADCEILKGKILHGLIEELYASKRYDTFFGVEERSNGHPTAQTVGARKGSELVAFMKGLYEKNLPEFWAWREKRGLIGPQLMALFFYNKGFNQEDDGFFKHIDEPQVVDKSKVYPQTYFSPKFTILGTSLDVQSDKTCVYHMFANSNVDFSGKKRMKQAREKPLTFSEYQASLDANSRFPKLLDASWFHTNTGEHTDNGIRADGANGTVMFGPYISLPAGEYFADLRFSRLSNEGEIEVRVTEESGRRLLASQRYVLPLFERGTARTPPFVTDGKASDLEIVLNAEGVDTLEITGVELHRGAAQSKPVTGTSYLPVVRPEPTDSPQLSLSVLPLAVTSPKTLNAGQSDSIAQLRLPGATESRMVKAGSLKILHRIYFGFDGKPDSFPTYLKTWEAHLPEYQIMHWNASNLPMDVNPWVRELLLLKDHAFLTDYFRWYVLREYGGVYLDADVEIVNGRLFNSLVEELEVSNSHDAFIGIDEDGGGWYTAHSMASKPQSDLSTFMCELYDNFGKFTAWRKKGFYFWAPQLVALYFANRGHNTSGMGTSPHLKQPVIVSRVKVYPQDWFSPLAPAAANAKDVFALNALTENTCICHHFACSWHDDDSKYLEHSKAVGGHSNALVKDLVARLSLKRVFGPAQLLTTVGMKTSDAIRTTGRPGCLVYGPYVTLDSGRYRLTVNTQDNIRTGSTTIDIAADLGERSLMPETGVHDLEDNPFVAEFVLDDAEHGVEFRLFVDDRSDFSVSNISVERF